MGMKIKVKKFKGFLKLLMAKPITQRQIDEIINKAVRDYWEKEDLKMKKKISFEVISKELDITFQKLKIKDGDTVVLKSHQGLTAALYDHLLKAINAWREKMGIKFYSVILDKGMDIEVKRKKG